MNPAKTDLIEVRLTRTKRVRASLRSTERIPRVMRLMALAIRSDKLIRDGVVCHHGELARLAHVSRARVSQVMGLLNLAPDLQEQLLHLDFGVECEQAFHEREVRAIARQIDWRIQRELWAKLLSRRASAE